MLPISRTPRAASRQPRPANAFTLVELLVVMAIIALLISILLPSLKGAKSKAETAACLSKIKALGIALQTYFADYDGTFPINGLLMPKSGLPTVYAGPNADPRFRLAEEKNQQKWRLEYGGLWRYMGGTPVDSAYDNPSIGNTLPKPSDNLLKGFICQTDWNLGRNRTLSGAQSTVYAEGPLTLQPGPNNGAVVTVGPGAPGYWSYSVNAVTNSLGRFRNNPAFVDGTPWGDPLRYVSIRSPSLFIIFIEEDDGSKFNDEVFDPPAYNGGDLLTDRHDHNGNVGFADGHADTFNAVVFNNQPAPNDGVNIANSIAMQSPVTRMFFPDYGNFASGGP